jgi:hypothetical protein
MFHPVTSIFQTGWVRCASAPISSSSLFQGAKPERLEVARRLLLCISDLVPYRSRSAGSQSLAVIFYYLESQGSTIRTVYFGSPIIVEITKYPKDSAYTPQSDLLASLLVAPQALTELRLPGGAGC